MLSGELPHAQNLIAPFDLHQDRAAWPHPYAKTHDEWEAIMMRRTGFTRIAALAGLFIAAMFSKAAAADETLKVELWDRQDGSQGVVLSAAEVKAGNVTFEVTNSSKGMEHEFLYVKTDMTADQLPMQEAGIKVDEGKLTGFHEFGDVEPGETKSWSADLEPGRYLLFCNEEGHFMAGMHTILMVTP